jgi:hypothetical protein
MTHEKLLEQLGPLPTYTEVGDFLGIHFSRIVHLVKQGKLEAVQTNLRKRIVVASLFKYLQEQQNQDAILAQELERRKIFHAKNAEAPTSEIS